MSYAVKLGLAAIAFMSIGVLGIVVFGQLWARIGLIAAIVIVSGPLLYYAWRVDRKAREARAGLERI